MTNINYYVLFHLITKWFVDYQVDSNTDGFQWYARIYINPAALIKTCLG